MKSYFTAAALSPLLLAACVGCGSAEQSVPMPVASSAIPSTVSATQRPASTTSASAKVSGSGTAEATVDNTTFRFTLFTCRTILTAQADGVSDDGTTLELGSGRIELHGPTIDFVGGTSEWALNFSGYTASGAEVSGRRHWSLTLRC